MTNAIIVGILLVVLVVALLRMKKHFRGGGCCGSGGSVVRTKKTLTEPKTGEIVLTVEGMTCENCAARVENTINRMEGAACTVNLKKKQAVIALSRDISAETLKAAVEEKGYKVTAVKVINT